MSYELTTTAPTTPLIRSTTGAVIEVFMDRSQKANNFQPSSSNSSHVPDRPTADKTVTNDVPWRLYFGGRVKRPIVEATPVYALFRVPSGDLWATVGDNVMVYQQDEWQKISTPSNYTIAYFGSFLWYRDHIWATGLQLLMYDQKDWYVANPEHLRLITSTAVDVKGCLWVGTYVNGLWQTCDGHLWEQVHLPNDGLSIGALCADHLGGIWIAETGHKSVHRPIHRWHQDTWTTLPLPPKAGAFRDIGSLVVDQSMRLWAGSSGGGVWLWANEKWKHFSGTTLADRKPGLPGDWIRGLYADRHQRIWAITDGGVGCYDNNTLAWHLALPVPEPHALFDLNGPPPEGHYLDTEGRLWISTRQGDIMWLDIEQEAIAYPFDYVTEHNARLSTSNHEKNK